MSFNSVKEFEEEIAKFYGAPYAVATDCCTHAIELCLRIESSAAMTIPSNTYISIPFIGNSRIIDAAVYWKENGYIANKLMCLSFQYKKHLGLGRGGAILLDDKDLYNKLKRMSYDGRDPDIPWTEQDISEIGYHYYMTPETAMLGLNKLTLATASLPKKWSWKDYPDLRNMTVFKKNR